MKTFIVNSMKGVVEYKKKLDITSELIGKEWLMVSDDPSISNKYIFFKDGKMLISVNGLSTYTTWQMATASLIILDEGIATFLYKIFHIDENIIILNLDGTNNFCFLINEENQNLSKASFSDIQWYLFRHCGIDILSQDQRDKLQRDEEKLRKRKLAIEKQRNSYYEKETDFTPYILGIIGALIVLIIMIVALFLNMR